MKFSCRLHDLNAQPARAARARRSHHHPKPRTEGEALSRLPWRPTNDVSMNEMHTPNSIEHSARQYGTGKRWSEAV